MGAMLSNPILITGQDKHTCLTHSAPQLCSFFKCSEEAAELSSTEAYWMITEIAGATQSPLEHTGQVAWQQDEIFLGIVWNYTEY